MTQPCSITPAAERAGSPAPTCSPCSMPPARAASRRSRWRAPPACPRGADAAARVAGGRDYLRLLDAGAELAQDAHFGLHVGECVKLGAYSVYGLVLLACRDFGQAFEQTMRYEALAHDLGRSRLSLDGASARYEWMSHYPDASRHLADSVLPASRPSDAGSPAASCRRPSSASRMRGGADTREYERVFGALPRFKAPANAAHFDAALLALPLPNADITLVSGAAAACRTPAAASGKRRRRPSWPRCARHHPQPGARPRAPERHRGRAGLSPRTLQRKLADAGASFQQVLDAAATRWRATTCARAACRCWRSPSCSATRNRALSPTRSRNGRASIPAPGAAAA